MILKNPRARGLLAAILLSSIGTGVHILALGQLLFELTGSPQAFATVLAFQGVGAVCILLLSGPLVDALDSKKVYIACDVARSVIVLGIVAITALAVPKPIPYIIAAAVLLAIFDNIQRSALFKFCARHIGGEDLLGLNSFIGVAVQGGILTGMSLLGLILIKGTPSHALLVDVAASALSALMVSSIRIERPEIQGALTAAMLKDAAFGVISDWRALFLQYRREWVVLVMLLICAADFVLSYSFSMLVVPLVDLFYAKQTWWITVFEATFAIGMICASFFTRFTTHQRMLPVWIALQAGAALVLARSSHPGSHFAAFFTAGFANLNSLTWLLTALQEHAAESDKAKMASLRLLGIGIGTAVLLPVVGRLSAHSLSGAYTGVAFMMFAFAACGLWVAHSFRPRPA